MFLIFFAISKAWGSAQKSFSGSKWSSKSRTQSLTWHISSGHSSYSTALFSPGS